MLNALVGYWSQKGLQILRFRNGRAERLAEGSLDELKPHRGVGKKVLIVGKELLHHRRLKYPPMPAKNVEQAVQSEIDELFPLKNPGYYLRVFRSTNTYTIVDLWAWESSDLKRLKNVLPFAYIVPEDVTFVSDRPELTVYSRNSDLGYVFAHSEQGFLGSTAFRGSISPEQIEMFLRSLADYRQKIRTVNLYGQDGKAIAETLARTLSAQTVFREQADYPPSIHGLAKLDLKSFRSKAEEPFSFRVDLAMRIVIYLILSYALVSYLTGRNYTDSIQEMSRKIDRLSKDIAALSAAPKNADHSDILRVLEQRLKKKQSPLGIMNLLAKSVPDKSFINRVVMNENSVELSLVSKEPISVIRALEGAEGIKAVKLRGSPSKDAKGLYTFVLFLDMK